MIIRKLSRGQAQEEMKKWIDICPKLPEIEDEWIPIRKELQAINRTIRNEIDNSVILKRGDYYLDYRFALKLYAFFEKKNWFSMRVAADDGFWRYLSIKVAPDVVGERWGVENESHYWSRPARVWFKSLWWYVYYSYQGDLEATEKVLSCDFFTTDTIVHFAEFTGRYGVNIESYRKIIKYYSMVPQDIIFKNSRYRSGTGDDIFRVVMKLNTARLMIMDPALCEGREDAYAKSLFRDAGVDFEKL